MDSTQTPLYSPLSFPEGLPREPSTCEKLLMWIPIIGWTGAAALAHLRIDPCTRSIKRQLEGRSPVPRSVWGDERRADVAEEITARINDAIGWKHPYFIPEDPFRIVIELDTGDLCEVEALMNIEEAFQTDFLEKPFGSEQSVFAAAVDMTFSKFVDFVISRSPRFGKDPQS
jgi:hypothetical protein